MLLAALLAASWLLPPDLLADDGVDLRGLVLRDELRGAQLERAVLRSEGLEARRYRALSGLFVVKAPSQQAWDSVVAPALERAAASQRPIEALRSTLLGLGDALIGSSTDNAVRLSFYLPGDRGEGLVGLAAPVLIGPRGGKTGHIEPNRMRVITGIQANPVSGQDAVFLEAIGLPNRPSLWTDGALRLADLQVLPYGGEGAWVKFGGKLLEEGDELEMSDLDRLSERLLRSLEADSFDVRKLPTWPGQPGDERDLLETLRAARYDTRVLDREGALLSELRRPESALRWQDKRIKHPTRFGVATLPVSAEVVVGKKLVERTEVLAFVYLYTPLLVPFDAAHLYLSVAPETLVRAVQDGSLPFFAAGKKAYFYLHHLDRW
ncbi:MAG: hypothetical protein CMP23_00625 [Rickettsiales bacterium]|nr:hypothetical protein [Rickettsiales bacterium]